MIFKRFMVPWGMNRTPDCQSYEDRQSCPSLRPIHPRFLI
jgi:hypothetical protein